MCVKWRIFYVLVQILARASARTCLFGYTGGDLIGPYSSTTCERFVALTPKPSLASVSTRSNAGVGTMPTYDAAGGPNGNGHVSFRRVSLQYLDGGARTFNIASNGGLTIVAVVRFTGTIGFSESFVDFDNIVFERYTNEYKIRIYINNNGQNVIDQRSGIIIYQDIWMTVKFTYRASTNEYVLSNTHFNDSPASVWSGISTAAVTDRTVSATYVGRQWSTIFAYSNIDLAGLFVVDEYLNTDATNQIADAMSNGVDLADTTCPAGNACPSCPVGQYKTTPGTAACIDCGTGKYSKVVAVTACIDCVPGTYANTLAATTCIACPTGTYSNVPGATACTQCKGNSFSVLGSSTSTACTCNAGYYDQTCSDASWVVGCSNIYADPEMCSRYSTICITCCGTCARVGNTCNQDSVCVTCSAGKYDNANDVWACIDCPTNSNSVAGSATVGACNCKVGYTGPDGVECGGCAAGKYKNTTGSAPCTSCLTNSYSVSASTTCTCNAGFSGPNGGACTQCVAGRYKSARGSDACITCPVASWSTAGAGSCASCPSNSGASCSECTALISCTCNTGFVGPDGGTCTSCAAGKYKNATGSAACMNCPANANSLTSSSVITACLCNAGFYGPNGTACTACGTATYKNTTGTALCASCPPNSGASCSACNTSRSCICNTGFYGNSDSCMNHTTPTPTSTRTPTSTPTSTPRQTPRQTQTTATSTPAALAPTGSTDSLPIGIIIGVCVAFVLVSGVVTAICCVSAR